MVLFLFFFGEVVKADSCTTLPEFSCHIAFNPQQVLTDLVSLDTSEVIVSEYLQVVELHSYLPSQRAKEKITR